MTAAAAHNAGRIMVNVNYPVGYAGEFPFLNVLKMGAEARYITGSAYVSPSDLNSDGYPTVINNGGVYWPIYIPTQTDRPGNYKVTFSGSGTIFFANATLATGSASTSGFTITPTDSAGALNIGISSGTNISNLQVFHVNDETALNAGGVFNDKFKQRISEANFGVIRFLNWQFGNNSNISLWADRKPTTYVTYAGQEGRAGLYVSSAATQSGKTYSCSAPSTWPGLVNGAKAIIKFATNFSGVQSTATFTNGSSTINVPSHGCSVNDTVRFSNSLFNGTPSNIVQQVTYYIKTVIDVNNVTIAATQGGTAIVASSAGSGTTQMNPMPLLNVGSTGAYPLASSFCEGLRGDFNNYPATGHYGLVAWDSTLSHWLLWGGSSSQDFLLNNGVPPEIMVQLCAEMGAHPYFVSPTLSVAFPTGDYMTGLATYCRDNAPSWMKPKFEGGNEPWNTQFEQTAYGRAIALALGWGQFKELSALGKFMSLLGQAVSSVYSADRTRYDIVLGTQTVSWGNPTSNDESVDSASYVAAGGSAAKNWVTHLAISQYIFPGVFEYAGTAAQTDLATRYAAGEVSALNSYVDTCLSAQGTGGNGLTVAQLLSYFSAIKTYAQSKGINKVIGYEGGWSPDYYGGDSTDVHNLKVATKSVYNVGAYVIGVFQGFMALSDSTFTAEYPAQFLIGDGTPSTYGWAPFNGSIYTATLPVWTALCSLGSSRRAPNLRIRIHG